jgi:hypothetical protein
LLIRLVAKVLWIIIGCETITKSGEKARLLLLSRTQGDTNRNHFETTQWNHPE